MAKNAELAVHPLDVCREDDALVTVPLGRRRDEFGVLEGSRVDTDFIGPALEHPVKIFQRVDAAAHRQGMKISLATRVRISVKRARPSKLAVMS